MLSSVSLVAYVAVVDVFFCRLSCIFLGRARYSSASSWRLLLLLLLLLRFVLLSERRLLPLLWRVIISGLERKHEWGFMWKESVGFHNMAMMMQSERIYQSCVLCVMLVVVCGGMGEIVPCTPSTLSRSMDMSWVFECLIRSSFGKRWMKLQWFPPKFKIQKPNRVHQNIIPT